MPDTIRLLLVVAVLGGTLYGGAWLLATFPPERSEIVKSLPVEKLRQH